jgi:AcrR family transcriptional regulator
MSPRRTLEMLARASLTSEDCPDPDQLAAYILNMLSGNEQLAAANHVRGCPICQEEIALVRPPEPRPRPLIARLISPGLTAGVRGPSVASRLRQYQAADLTIELTFTGQGSDYARVTGQILRAGVPGSNLAVLLRRGRRRAYEQQSDAEGFFTFVDLPAGRYTLSVTDGVTSVQVQGLDLPPAGG